MKNIGWSNFSCFLSIYLLSVFLLSGCLQQPSITKTDDAVFSLGTSPKDRKIARFIQDEYFKKLPKKTQLQIFNDLKQLKDEEEIDYYLAERDPSFDPNNFYKDSNIVAYNLINNVKGEDDDANKATDKEQEEESNVQVSKAVRLEKLPKRTISTYDRYNPNDKVQLNNTRNYLFDSYGNPNDNVTELRWLLSNREWYCSDSRLIFPGGGKILMSPRCTKVSNYNPLFDKLHFIPEVINDFKTKGYHHVQSSKYGPYTKADVEIYLTARYGKNADNSFAMLNYFTYGFVFIRYLHRPNVVYIDYGLWITDHDVLAWIGTPPNPAITDLKMFETKNFDAKYFGKVHGYHLDSGFLSPPAAFSLGKVSHGDVEINVKARAGTKPEINGVLDFTKTGMIGFPDGPFKSKIVWSGNVYTDNPWPSGSKYDVNILESAEVRRFFRNNNKSYDASIEGYNAEGKIHLNFFGPNAEEIGGTFNFILAENWKSLDMAVGGNRRTTWTIFNGAFGAKR